MKTKIINWKEEFNKLFPDTTERELKDNHKWCEKCNGIGFHRNGKYIEFCTLCRGKGQIELCIEKCGREKYNYYSVCKECKEELDNKRLFELNNSRYEKATKIKYKDYEGNFLINERVMDKEEFEEYLYDKIYNKEEVETYVYGTKKEQVMSINFLEVVKNACEDGYEDMITFLDKKGIDVIQNMIDKWIEEQGDSNYIYYEDGNLVVLLDDLIAEIKEEIKNEYSR